MKALKFLMVALATFPLLASAADPIQFSYDYYTGTTGTDWNKATATLTTINDAPAYQYVELKLDTTALTSSGFVGEWSFNVKDLSVGNADLKFAAVPAGAYSSVLIKPPYTGVNALQNYNINFFFDNNDFKAGEVVTIDIYIGNSLSDLTGSITAENFLDFNSKDVLGEGDYYSSFHVQSITGGDSAKFASTNYDGGGGGGSIPEPSTYAAFAGLAALALGVWRRRQAIG